MATTILGISAYYHDSAAALIIDGDIVAAVQEERFTRKKHDPAFPTQSISYCLDEANIKLNDVDYVVFYDKPLVKFERLLETYLSFVPQGFISFMKSMPIWLKDKLFLKTTLRRELISLATGGDKKKRKALNYPDFCLRRTIRRTLHQHFIQAPLKKPPCCVWMG